MKLICNKSNPPLGGIITAEYVKLTYGKSLELTWAEENVVEKAQCRTNVDVTRAVARLYCQELYGSTAIEMTEVDHWLTFSLGPLTSKTEFITSLNHLNKTLGPVTYLVNKRLSIADFAIFSALYRNKQWQDLLIKKAAPVNVQRWYNFILMQAAVENSLKSLPDDVKSALIIATRGSSAEKQVTASGRKKEGNFVDLPEAEMGKVVVRFPPEASGYLHIGHAKAALLNQYYQEAFQGKLIMRFDDTNPAKEDLHFEKVILEDVAMLNIKPEMFTHTSQYFDLMLQYCEKMIKDGSAYVDDTEAELMKTQREQRMESSNRLNSVDKNMKMWEEMKKGSSAGQKCCVRAKIDMQSANGCMRDPTIYRCKDEPHPKTGTKYKVYPTYDFACPIVDSIEGVTHTLRTMEYHDRDPQFYWFIDALGLRKPYIWEYSRLSMTNTVLSKRKLTWFVQQGLVDGWDDPRMPTVRGVLRRGMTVEGLREFIIAQGSSRSVVFMEWDKIWAFNKKVIDPVAPRFTAVEKETVTVLVTDIKTEECVKVAKHPKNADVGEKEVWLGPRLLIDVADAEVLKEGENATFIHWGNLMIKKVNRQNGKITTVEAQTNLENKDFKKTPKVTFLCDTQKAKITPTFCVYFDHIISKALLSKDEDFKDFIGHETRKEIEMLGDPEFKNLKQGDIIQIQRKGFFRVDVPYKPIELSICKEQPIILFYIPDGSSKDGPLSTKTDKTSTTSNKKAEKLEKQPAGAQKAVASTENDILSKIAAQGEKVRDLKAQKSEKAVVDQEVKVLLSLKTDFKALSGKDWKPGMVASTPAAAPAQVISTSTDESAILSKIVAQGEKVRDLKAQKAEKAAVDQEVKVLLSLKADFKTLTGKDWKPGMVASATAAAPAQAGPNSTEESAVLSKIVAQGEKVRDLKAQKAEKAAVDQEVKVLLALKADFKTLTGKDWKPGMVACAPAAAPAQAGSNSTDESAILSKIAVQGERVRDLKAQKAEKAVVDQEVKVLLSLKTDFKALTGKDWKPGMVASAPAAAPAQAGAPTQGGPTSLDESSILSKIAAQGEKVRDLKAQKAEKAAVDQEVKVLLALKTDFKVLTGKDWKPGQQPTLKPIKPEPLNNSDLNMSAGDSSDNVKQVLTAKVTEQGNLVRDLKAKKASKEEVDKAVKLLLELKEEYKNVIGEDFPVAGRQNQGGKSNNKENKGAPKEVKEKVVKQATKKSEKEKKSVDVSEESSVKKQTRLGLEAKKETALSDWYSQVITKGEMIEYYDVSGCYILRPWSFAVWEAIRDWFDTEIKKMGVQNCYFPIFVSKSVLEKEKTHIADFAPEVAWVTKSGDSDIAEPIAVRPTSETVMYPAYAKWIQSYRDLPIKLNQWNNVVRWEFKHPQPFLRTREFLWQEGHTAYALKEEADVEVQQILDLYAKVYTDLLAIPVVKGRKTEKEKFAGGDYTLTVEGFISASGRAIQGATSHHLGQNFSRMFDIIYEDPETQEKKFVYQNSWGITTRTIGVMIMVHADNQGLVLPPRVAAVQVVIVPCGITATLSDKGKEDLQKSCDELEESLNKAGVKVKGDYRSNYSPGWKFNHWELKGVPIRVELGPKDIEKKQLVAVRRDTGEKITISRENAVQKLSELLENIHDNLYKKACEDLKSHMVQLNDWAEFSPSLEKKNIILAPFCGDMECEDRIKADSTRDDAEPAEPGAPAMGAKSLCIPLDQPCPIKSTDKCIHPSCKNKPKFYTLFGRSY